MKSILVTLLILVNAASYSQVITDTTLIKGKLRDSYYMFDRPDGRLGKQLRLMRQGDFIYIIGIVTTTGIPPQDVWYHCVYKEKDGFIPSDLIEVIGDWSTDKLLYLRENKNVAFQRRIVLSKSASVQDGLIADSIEKKKQEEIISLNARKDSAKSKLVQDISNRAKVEKLLIISYSFPTNILDYPGFNIRFINGFDKPIKYITFKIVAYNPVNDIVGRKDVRGIGEIPSFSNAEYRFDDIFFSKVTNHYSIPTVKIQFMDNSIVKISGKPLFENYYFWNMEELEKRNDFESIVKEVYYSHIK